MKITGSDVRLAAQHDAVQRDEKHESLNAWRDTPNGRVELKLKDLTLAAGATLSRSAQQGVSLQLSDAARQLQPTQAAVSGDELEPPGPEDDFRIRLLMAVMEQLTGHKFKVFDPRELQQSMAQAQVDTSQLRDPNAGSQPAPANQREGWGLVYDAYTSHYESESVQFSAQGTLKTADGQEISFTVDLNMSRTFASEQHINVRAGDALKDPLVINFNGSAAQLTQDKFSFDIDSDGRSEQVAFVGPNSGFLALDKNGDGKVNDGSELFGPQSGNGFADLAKYDADHNGWIDESDPVYNQLRIWTRDAGGQDHLFALGDKGVGAIFLGNIATPFTLKDSENQTQGQVRSGGLYVGEQGNVGTVQQVDLVV